MALSRQLANHGKRSSIRCRTCRNNATFTGAGLAFQRLNDHASGETGNSPEPCLRVDGPGKRWLYSNPKGLLCGKLDHVTAVGPRLVGAGWVFRQVVRQRMLDRFPWFAS